MARIILCVVASFLMALTSCAATKPPQGSEIDRFIGKQNDAMNRANYERLRPAIDEIKPGDTRERVFIAIPQTENGKAFELKRGSHVAGIVFEYNWPGVLTPFDAQSYLTPDKLEEMHLGYLENGMLQLKKVIIFQNDKVAQILAFSPANEMIELGMVRPGREIGKTDHMGRDYYEKVFLPKKERIIPGMHIWEMFNVLGANYIKDGQSYAILCPSYLNYKTGVKTSKTNQGTRALYPFGYLEGDREIIKWQIETLNNRITAVKAYQE